MSKINLELFGAGSNGVNLRILDGAFKNRMLVLTPIELCEFLSGVNKDDFAFKCADVKLIEFEHAIK